MVTNGNEVMGARDEEIFNARVAGQSMRRIAYEHRMDVAEVQSIIERYTPMMDARARAIAFGIELERLDRLTQTFYEKAQCGDVQAGMLCLRIGERRAALLGLDTPKRVDLVTNGQEAMHPQTTTERIQSVLSLQAENRAPEH